jgi:hypothetical protein
MFPLVLQSVSEEFGLLGCYAMKLVEIKPMFRRNISPPYSEWKRKPSKKLELCLIFDLEYGGNIFLRNVSWLSTDYRGYIVEYKTFHSHDSENLKFYKD